MLITIYDALLSMYLVVAVIYVLINFAINKASVYVARARASRSFARTGAS